VIVIASLFAAATVAAATVAAATVTAAIAASASAQNQNATESAPAAVCGMCSLLFTLRRAAAFARGACAWCHHVRVALLANLVVAVDRLTILLHRVRFARVMKALGARRAPPEAARLFIALAAEKLPARGGRLVVVVLLLLAAARCVLFVTIILSRRLTAILSCRLVRCGGGGGGGTNSTTGHRMDGRSGRTCTRDTLELLKVTLLKVTALKYGA